MPTGEAQKELYYIDRDGKQFKVNDIPAFEIITSGIFDQEETYTNCTVQILTNSVTGEISLGWWKNAE